MTTRVGMVTSTLDHGLSGPNRALLNICTEINKRQLDRFEFKYIHNESSDLRIYNTANEVIVPRTPIKFERALINLDLDIIYYPHFPKLRPGFFFLNSKKVVHLHGDLPYAIPSLVPPVERYRQYALATFYRWSKLSQEVDYYLAASDSLIQNKMRELGVSRNKFVRTELAPAIPIQDSIKQDTNKVLDQLGITSEYILDVASNTERKNVAKLIDAMALLKQRGIDTPLLVIAGDWENTNMQKYGNDKLGSNVIFTGHIDDKELVCLYRNAEFYVNPTKHEAFGLTNVEAMAAGLPIITSDRFAVPEVVGDAALYINNPESINEISRKIQLFLEEKNERSRYAERARERAKRYSWEKTVDRIVSVFDSLSND